ncbi:MAG: synthase epsilon subunit [Pseudomonadota bacterium]|jgi:F-type H+-transporting ATPase subunit epsilon
MSDKVEFELVSPEKLLVSQPVEMVVVPGADGLFGVLPGHAPMIVTVKPGVIDVYAANQTDVSRQIFVAGGFAEVTEKRVTVLAQEAMELDAVKALDAAVLQKTLVDLREDLGEAKTETERKTVKARIAATATKLELVTGQPVAH